MKSKEHDPEYLLKCWIMDLAPGEFTIDQIDWICDMAVERADSLLESPSRLGMAQRLILALGLAPVAIPLANWNLSDSQKREDILHAARRILAGKPFGPSHNNPASLDGADWNAWRFNTLLMADLEWLIGSTDAAVEHYRNVKGVWQDPVEREVSTDHDELERLCSRSFLFYAIETYGR